MPVGALKQNFDTWSLVLDGLDINENMVVIAHSIASIFVCKYLITNRIKVKKLIFVCGFDNYLGIDEDFADTISNKQIVIENGGHINAESGYTEFAEILKYI